MRTCYAINLYFPNGLTSAAWQTIRWMQRQDWIRENVPEQTHWTYDVLDQRAVDMFPDDPQVVRLWTEPETVTPTQVPPSESPLVT